MNLTFLQKTGELWNLRYFPDFTGDSTLNWSLLVLRHLHKAYKLLNNMGLSFRFWFNIVQQCRAAVHLPEDCPRLGFPVQVLLQVLVDRAAAAGTGHKSKGP